MSVINSDSVRAGASGAVADAYTIEQSCRFNDDDSAYLKRTPGLDGNRRTWTFSFWVKRSKITGAANEQIFHASGGAANTDPLWTQISFNTADQFQVAGYSTNWRISTRLFRDPSAWYHFVVAFDSTQPAAADRLKIYVNGVEETAFSTSNAVPENQLTAFNAGGFSQNVGDRNDTTAQFFDGYLADLHLIDGQQLAATSFGETDDNGQWVAKEYAAEDESDLVMTYEDSLVSSTNATAYTFSSADLGTADANRYIAVAISTHGAVGRTVSSVTINGVTANVGVKQGNAANEDFVQIAWAHVPDDATGGIVITYSGSMNGTGIGIHRIIGKPYLHDVDGIGITGTAGQTNVNTVSGGVIINVTHNSNTASFSYTGITERYDEVEDGSHYHSGASDTVTTGAGQVSVLATCSSSSAIAVQTISFAPGKAYGTNGFRLDFGNSSFFGNDVRETVTYTACTVTNTASPVTTSNATSHTFSGESIGTASTGRKIVVVASGSGGSTGVVSGITIDGNAMTEVVSAPLDGEAYATIYERNNFNTGTTAEFIVSWSGSKGNCGLGVFAVTGATGENTILTGTSNADNPSATIGILNKGVAIGGVVSPHSSGLTTHSWTNLTEAYDEQVETTQSHSGASVASSSASASVTITATQSQATDNEAFVVASWGPDGDHSFGQSGLATNDQVTDSPSDDADNDIGNYSTMNPLVNGGVTLSNGNLGVSCPADKGTLSTMGMESGKWRIEATYVTANGSTRDSIGICSLPDDPDRDIPFSGWLVTSRNAENVAYNALSGQKITSGAYSSYGDGFVATDIIDVFFDADTGTVWFANEGVLQNSATEAEVEAGTTTNAAATGLSFHSGNAYFCISGGGSGTGVWTINFGQHAYTNTYSSITSFKNLCTANLAAPAIKDPSEFFGAMLYTGTGSSAAHTFGGNSNCQPDLVYIMDREVSYSRLIHDSPRGVQKYLATDSDAVEADAGSNYVSSFDTDGFTEGGGNGTGNVDNTHVAWGWKAGAGAGSSNEVGGINTTTTSLGAAQGFSISTYTGTGSASTVGHGLGAVPQFMIVKERTNDVGGWFVYHKDNSTAPETDYLYLHTNAGQVDDATVWNDTAPTSTVFSIGAHDDINESSGTYVAYIWTGIEGFSKFGSYTGKGSAALGNWVWCGFRPKLVMLKVTDTSGGWHIYDTARSAYNVVDKHMDADVTTVEGSLAERNIDILSNGFRLRTANDPNSTGNLYLFAAWAESPFGGSGVAQARAR